MPVRIDPAVVSNVPRTNTVTGPVRPPAPVAPSPPRRGDAFDATHPRADGSLLVGRRTGGPGEVSLSKAGELQLDGKSGSGAQLETARLIETGLSPFAHATEAQRAAVTAHLAKELHTPDGHKPSSSGVLSRSAAATLLLSIARTAEPATRDAALAAYVGALGKETDPLLRKSMLVNLDFTRLPVPSGAGKVLDGVRAELLPTRPPYDEWFKGQSHPKLEIRHYVMDEFWKPEIAAWKSRGFEIVSQNGKTVELKGTVKDPTGKNPPTEMHVVMHQGEDNVLRDMDDPKVNMILYSGHAQLGGVVDGSVTEGPKKMNGTKLVQLFNCRGKQTDGALAAKYPGAQVTSTWSSAYGDDDKKVLDATLKTLAARADYGDVRKQLSHQTLIQPKSNYMLPDDPRNLGTRDDDRDGLNDSSALGPDRFFDPGKLATRGGANIFSPAAIDDDPQQLSGAKLSHAVGYANTSFFYFSEESHAAPIAKPNTDRMLPGGWFVGPPDEKVRFTSVKKDGQTWTTVQVNSKLASRSREVITATVLYETQKHFCELNHGSMTESDKLHGLMLVGGYLDLYCQYSDQINDVLGGFSKAYGFSGVNYDTYYAASKLDGEEGNGSKAALDYLKSHGISVQ